MTRRLIMVGSATLTSLVVGATVFAAPLVPLPAVQRGVQLQAAADDGRGTISLIPLENEERTLVAIAATFDVSKYCDATSVMVTARVNGVVIEPPFPAFVETRTIDGCSATGIFRLDLDAAELAHPGAFIGQPLNVTLTYWG